MPDLFLGLDIGTSSIKGVVIDTAGKVICQSDAANEMLSPYIGWAEQNVESWKHNIGQVIKTCVSDLGDSASDIHGIGVSGMIPALVLLDHNHQVLRPVLQYNDSRAVQEIQEYSEKIGSKKFFEITGASLSVQSVGPKLAWIRKHEPQIWEKTVCVMGSYDYINHFLTGEISVERNWALESGLMNIHTQSWSKDLVTGFDLPESILPPIRSSLEIMGLLNRQMAKTTGLTAGIPVIAGSADHVAAALAAGIIHQGDVLIKFGSSGDLLYCSDQPVLDPRLYIDFHCLPGKYLPNGCMATSGSLLKWYVNGFCQADLQDAQKQGINIYEYLDMHAGKIRPGSDGVLVLPYFLGAKTPLNDPDARGVFFGLTLSHSRHHLYRSILESVVYGFRDHFEVLHQLGLPINRVVASEGGARSPIWRQISADVLGRPVEYLQTNPGSAFGAALMAGMALQKVDMANLPHNQSSRIVVSPNLEVHSQYETCYRLYRCLYDQLRPITAMQKQP